MNQAEVISTLLIVVAALAILAKKVALAYPLLLVIAGLALGYLYRKRRAKPYVAPLQLCIWQVAKNHCK